MQGTVSPAARPLVLFAAAFVAALAPSAASGSSTAGDLDLRDTVGAPFTIIEADMTVDDPHDMECDGCHGVKEEDSLKTGDDSIGLCRECHPRSNLHPVGISPSGEMDPASADLPLGKGSLEGKITCLTCHYIHSDAHRAKLLRIEYDTEKSRMELLCAACHSNRLREKSPHSTSSESCHLCHMNPPRKGEGLESLGPNVQGVCNFCHNAIESRHYLAVNPFEDEYILNELMEVNIPLLNGRLTCISCHNPHAAESRKKLLREDYLMLAGISKGINPHWKDVMCVACHEEEPRRGRAPLKEGGDLVRLCYRCHAFKYSRHEMHPVNMSPAPGTTVPAYMPLKDGRVTCETCHDSSLQEGGEGARSAGKRNPKFLRGGFTSRIEFCFRCHAQEAIRVFNAHDQVDTQGRKRMIKCLFCHSSVPREETTVSYRMQFDEETVNDLCLLCHAPNYQRKHPLAPHFVTPSPETLELIETSEERLGVTFPLFDEKVVCITCHNPHQEGVIEGELAAAGAGRAKRLRTQGDGNMCRGCHLSK